MTRISSLKKWTELDEAKEATALSVSLRDDDQLLLPYNPRTELWTKLAVLIPFSLSLDVVLFLRR